MSASRNGTANNSEYERVLVEAHGTYEDAYREAYRLPGGSIRGREVERLERRIVELERRLERAEALAARWRKAAIELQRSLR